MKKTSKSTKKAKTSACTNNECKCNDCRCNDQVNCNATDLGGTNCK